MDEAELLFTGILNCDRASLYLERDRPLAKEKAAFVARALERRILREPLQYILGKTEFMGLEFKLNCQVLIPRQETEILVEAVLRIAGGYRRCKILDIGTGSGNIAVSLAKFLPQAQITATDISRGALDIAQENAKRQAVAGKIKFIQSDLFASLPISDKRYALCVSNPPYIPTGQIRELAPEIKYEPVIALDGGIDGLDFYRRIAAQAPKYLEPEGFLILEIGFGQLPRLKGILRGCNFEIIEVIKDYSNIERVIVARPLQPKTVTTYEVDRGNILRASP